MGAEDRVIWRDGEFIAWADATVHVLAQSLQRGSLAFDYMAVHRPSRGPAVFRVDDHIRRLFNTCGIMGLPIAYEVDELIEATLETVRRNEGARSVRISALFPSVEVELVPRTLILRSSLPPTTVARTSSRGSQANRTLPRNCR